MFKKSIFSQLFGFTVSVFVISFFIIATLLYSFLGGYVTDKQEEDLKESASKVNDLTVFYMQNKDSFSEKIYKLNLDAYSANASAFIIILDANGKPFATTGAKTSIEVKKEFYQDVLDGNEVKYLGNFGGLFNTTMLTVGLPLEYNNAVIGATFLSVAVPEINRLRFDVFRIFLFTVGLVVIVALVFIYVISRRITAPIKELTEAARHIANGDFNLRVQLDTQNEIGQLGNTFNEMADSLAQLEDMRSSFVSNVSHELRTPMTTITGFVQGIMDGTIPPEKQGQYLSIVLDESKRLSRLVNDLLDLSRMDQGKLKLEKQPFDINEQMRLQIIKAERRIDEKHIDILVDFQTASQYVTADRDSILRVLTNLIDNAIKFTPDGGYIELKSGIENKKVYISITNSGPGIAPKDLKHIFDRFYKTDKSRSMDKNGVGLGLYFVKSIINTHGEEIWVTSEVEKYTRFTFTLTPSEKPQDRA